MKIRKPWTNKLKAYKGVQKNKVSRDEYPVPNRGRYFEYSNELLFDEVLLIPSEDGTEEKLVNTETGEIVDPNPQGPEESVEQAKVVTKPEAKKAPVKPTYTEKEPEVEYPTDEELMKVKKSVEPTTPERFNLNNIYDAEGDESNPEEEKKEDLENFTF